MSAPDLDRAVAARATAQHGLVAARDVVALGGSPAAVRHRLATGRWRAAGPGVYRIAGTPVTWRSHLLAAVLAGGPGAVASHRSAGALHGLDGCRPGVPEVSVPRGRRYRPGGARVHESTDLHLADVRRVDGIPTTGPARTVLDLGAVLPGRRVHVALDCARRLGLTDWDRLLDTLVTHARRGRPGVGALRAILDAHHGESELTGSGSERLLAALLVTGGLPRPALQHEVRHDGRTYRIDLAYPAERVALEYDGSQHMARAVWESDHPRQNGIVLTGWTVLRYTRRDYLTEPDRILGEVRRALAQARLRGGP
jgi:hypothetical protein